MLPRSRFCAARVRITGKGTNKVMPGNALMFLRMIVLTIALSGCAQGPTAPPGACQASFQPSGEAGVIVRIRSVVVIDGHADLGPAQTTGDILSGDAANDLHERQMLDVRTNELEPGRRPQGGAIYTVRLGCGGIVRAFEDIPQRFHIGQTVLASFGGAAILLAPASP